MPTPSKQHEPKATWSGGLAEWKEHDTVYISVAFTWRLQDAYDRALFARAEGFSVKVGGPALFPATSVKIKLAEIAEVGGTYKDAIFRQHPLATMASQGCPVGCWFCIVPKMEGKTFTLIDNFPVRPILCDNNLSALPSEYQDFIIAKYRDANVKLRDANSGFEPLTFTPDVYHRWKSLINAGGGPWRFAYDETKERSEVVRVMRMLSDERQKRKRVYVLIGNEPITDCLNRVQEVIDNGCEPYCQPLLKLNCLERKPWIRFDWTEEVLRNMTRWVNKWVWKTTSFADYDRHFRRNRAALARLTDNRQPLFNIS